MTLTAIESRTSRDSPLLMPNSPLAAIPGVIVRTLETWSLRGGPTILLLLSKVPALRRVMVTLPTGEHSITFPAYDPYWCRYLWAGAPYEEDIEQIFRRIGKGAVLIDCGANIGYWSIYASDFGFTQAIAVEANSNLIPILQENFELNSINGKVVHAAIYSRSGEELLLGGTDAHAQAAIGSKGIPVTSVTISEIASQFHEDQEFVAKLDVEGAELEAVDGASKVRNITFVYEDFPKHGMRVTSELLRRGMPIFGVSPMGWYRRIHNVEDAFAFNRASAFPKWPSNLIACRPENARNVEQLLSVE